MTLALLGVVGSVTLGAAAKAAEDAPPQHTAPVIRDFMADLPPSDDIPYKFVSSKGTLETATEQTPYWENRAFVFDHRFYDRHKKNGRKPKKIVVDALEAFRAECTAKGGTLELQGGGYRQATRNRMKLTWGATEICMASKYRAMSMLLVRNDNDWERWALVLFSPDIVATQAVLDREQEQRARAREQERQRAEQAAAREEERLRKWRGSVRAGTETNCGPVLTVKGDLVQIVYIRSRDARWFRLNELKPPLGPDGGRYPCER
ncbi:MAG: hypothetical protein KDE63_05745 [Novosphingobium sp.]|nr:hypothetical protein [Novosphingobium sp.]